MADTRQEILDCIAFYQERGWDWLIAVQYICFRSTFGSWRELVSLVRGVRTGPRIAKPAEGSKS